MKLIKGELYEFKYSGATYIVRYLGVKDKDWYYVKVLIGIYSSGAPSDLNDIGYLWSGGEITKL